MGFTAALPYLKYGIGNVLARLATRISREFFYIRAASWDDKPSLD
jgi:hypothetical protein